MDARIQHSVVANLSRRPEVVSVGPFVIGWDPTTDSRQINYASPQPGTPITAADVDALIDAFRQVSRVPRLEYVTRTAPGLEELLLARGFTVEERHDYLTCSPGSLVVPPAPEGIVIAEPLTEADRMVMVAAQNEAFGGEPVATPDDATRIERAQRAGGVGMLARVAAGPVTAGDVDASDVDTKEGSVIGGGQSTAPNDGVSEVAGIAVVPPFRRRGIAGALTAAITERLFAAGADCAWLEASGEDSWRVYERVGYAPAGKRLYIALG